MNEIKNQQKISEVEKLQFSKKGIFRGLRNILIVMAIGYLFSNLGEGLTFFGLVMLYPLYLYILLMDVIVLLPSFVGVSYLIVCLVKKQNPNNKLQGLLLISFSFFSVGIVRYILNGTGGLSNATLLETYHHRFSIPTDYSNLLVYFLIITTLSLIPFVTYGIILLLKSSEKLSKGITIILLLILFIGVGLNIDMLIKVARYHTDVIDTRNILIEVSDGTISSESNTVLLNKCRNIEFDTEKNICLQKLAIKSKNINICGEVNLSGDLYIEGQRYNKEECIKNSISSNQDRGFCLSLIDEDEEVFCLNEVIKKFPQEGLKEDNCQSLTQDGRDKCYVYLASSLRDKSLCEKVSDGPIDTSKIKSSQLRLDTSRQYCNFNVDLQIALDQDNWRYCSESKELNGGLSDFKNNCYIRFLNSSEDEIICAEMEIGGLFAEVHRSFCYFRLARTTGDFTLCHEIPKDYIKEDCIINNEHQKFSNIDKSEVIYFDEFYLL